MVPLTMRKQKLKVEVTHRKTEACVCERESACSVLHVLLLSGFCWIMLVEKGAEKKNRNPKALNFETLTFGRSASVLRGLNGKAESSGIHLGAPALGFRV